MPTRYIGDGYWEIISRQMSIVTRSQQERFKESKIAVIGCGGIGGETIEMLARMGVGQLNLVDEDAFDLSNLNKGKYAIYIVNKSNVSDYGELNDVMMIANLNKANNKINNKITHIIKILLFLIFSSFNIHPNPSLAFLMGPKFSSTPIFFFSLPLSISLIKSTNFLYF